MIYSWMHKLSVRAKADHTYRIEALIEEQLGKSIDPVINISTGQSEAPMHIAGLYALLGFNPSTDPDIADQIPSSLNISGEPVLGIQVYLPLLDLRSGYSLEKIAEKCNIRNPGEYIKEVYGKLPGDVKILGFDRSGNKLFHSDKKGFISVMSEILGPFLYLNRDNQIKYLRELQGIRKSDKPSILIVGAMAMELRERYHVSMKIQNNLKLIGGE